jgi:gamma-glutamylcyclotransferase (GGCT)/AIG2-like uncharacterized protein YtfP
MHLKSALHLWPEPKCQQNLVQGSGNMITADMTDEVLYLPLFVYGTLMSDQPAFDLIAASVERSLAGRVGGLVMVDMGRYPLAVAGDGVIVGEIHWLRRDGYRVLLHELAMYEGPEYMRARYFAHPLDGSPPIAVWLFVGQPAVAVEKRRIPSGDWRAWRHRQE